MSESQQISWATWGEACALIAKGATFRTASKIALVVGTLLTAINQGAVIVGGDATAATWLRAVANYLIPYAVASLGYLAPFRRR